MQANAEIDFGVGTTSDAAAAADRSAHAELIARAQLICGSRHVVTDPPILQIYQRYGTEQSAPAPLLVVLPGGASEVTRLVGACSALSVGWTVRGAGTGTDGSALPRPDHALIVLTRMRRILRPFNADREITVEPGVSVELLRSAVGEPVMPDASPSATVGGHVASVRGLRGVTGIEIVQPDGTLARSDERQPGYDFAGAFCGSRGLAGIAVSIRLRLVEP